MTLSPSEKQKHVEWLQQLDIRAYLVSNDIAAPWFPAFQSTTKEDHEIRWFAALVPPNSIPRLAKQDGWDIGPADGGPTIWTHYRGKEKTHRYCPFGNEDGVEPLVIWRSFHSIRPDFIELAQEFRLYYNLYPEPARKRFIHIDRNGDESEAARYGENFMGVRTDLLRRFCAAKQMALAIYVESFRYSRYTLAELGLTEVRTADTGDHYRFPLAIVPDEFSLRKKFETCSLVVGGKKYVRPDPMPLDDEPNKEAFQEFIIRADSTGKPVRHTCDPDRLANYFGSNPDAPHYLTPVFFRAEVLSKYYADPAKYSVEDGCLRCGGLWGLRIDNDHADYVVVWLGDLGRDLSENERNYWLSFNIPPEGRKISLTNFRRAFMAEPTDPDRPDLVFKHEYTRFNRAFREKYAWEFFLPLHEDDEHFFTGLHLLAKDNQAEFDSQLLALTKVLVDSINEKMISKDLTTLTKDDKGITKLEKWFSERGLKDHEPHIKLLRVLQNLRSKSAAHRKGSNYDKLVAELQIADEGQQRVFFVILTSACALIRYLDARFLPKESE
ncbi:MAG: hypothetical protein ACOY4D_01000 [Pseudomonadota bacterium]